MAAIRWFPTSCTLACVVALLVHPQPATAEKRSTAADSSEVSGDEASPVQVSGQLTIAEKKSGGHTPAFLSTAALVKHGFTFGMAAAFITKLRHSSPEPVQTGVSAMPYVGVLPFYWALGGISKDYCATRVLSLSSETARAVANQAAFDLAKDRGAELHPEAKKATGAYKKDTEAIRARTGWDRDLNGRCAAKWPWKPVWNASVGLYAGIPLSYDANVFVDEMGGGSYQKRAVRGRGSFGLLIAPVPYLNVLFGATRTVAEVPVGGDSESTRLKGQWQMTFGVGGTFDIFTVLVKALTG